MIIVNFTMQKTVPTNIRINTGVRHWRLYPNIGYAEDLTVIKPAGTNVQEQVARSIPTNVQRIPQNFIVSKRSLVWPYREIEYTLEPGFGKEHAELYFIP